MEISTADQYVHDKIERRRKHKRFSFFFDLTHTHSKVLR